MPTDSGVILTTVHREEGRFFLHEPTGQSMREIRRADVPEGTRFQIQRDRTPIANVAAVSPSPSTVRFDWQVETGEDRPSKPPDETWTIRAEHPLVRIGDEIVVTYPADDGPAPPGRP